MFHYVKNQKFLKNLCQITKDLMNQLKVAINREGFLQCKISMVGSGKRGLITQNEDEPIDVDFTLNIEENIVNWKPKQIKKYIKQRFDEILEKNGLPNCDDSTSALTTKKMWLKQYGNYKFTIDLAITRINGDICDRLIHKKTGIEKNDIWTWQNVYKNNKDFSKKVKKIQSNQKKLLKLKEIYLRKKNFYLRKNDHTHPSYICFIESIYEI